MFGGVNAEDITLESLIRGKVKLENAMTGKQAKLAKKSGYLTPPQEEEMGYMEEPEEEEAREEESVSEAQDDDEKPAFCTGCGRKTRDGDMFCGGCGKRF